MIEQMTAMGLYHPPRPYAMMPEEVAVFDLYKNGEHYIEIAKTVKEKLNHLKTNLFVSKELSEIVEENLNNAIAELQDLKLDVEKIKFYYNGLE